MDEEDQLFASINNYSFIPRIDPGSRRIVERMREHPFKYSSPKKSYRVSQEQTSPILTESNRGFTETTLTPAAPRHPHSRSPAHPPSVERENENGDAVHLSPTCYAYRLHELDLAKREKLSASLRKEVEYERNAHDEWTFTPLITHTPHSSRSPSPAIRVFRASPRSLLEQKRREEMERRE